MPINASSGVPAANLYPIPIDLTGTQNSLPEQEQTDAGHVLNINNDVFVKDDIVPDIVVPDDHQAYDSDVIGIYRNLSEVCPISLSDIIGIKIAI